MKWDVTVFSIVLNGNPTWGIQLLNKKLMSLLANPTFTVSTLILRQYIFKKSSIFKKKTKNLLVNWKYFRFSVDWRKQQLQHHSQPRPHSISALTIFFLSLLHKRHTHTHTVRNVLCNTCTEMSFLSHTREYWLLWNSKVSWPPWKPDSVYQKPAGGLFGCWSVQATELV